jgi:hypothetical protein
MCDGHRADRAAVVREVLAEGGIEAPETDRMAATVLAKDGLPRYAWEAQRMESPDYVSVLIQSIAETHRWRGENDDAKRLVASRASPEAVETSSATVSTA